MTIESHELIEYPEEDSVPDQEGPLPDDGADQPKPSKPRRGKSKPEPEPEPEPPAWQASPAEIAAALQSGQDAGEPSDEDLTRALVDRVMGNELPQKWGEPIRPIPASQFTERPFAVLGYEIRKSYFLDNHGVYVLIDAVELSTGEQFLIQTSAVNVLAQVLNAADLGALGVPVKIVSQTSQVDPTRQLLWLRPVDLPPEP